MIVTEADIDNEIALFDTTSLLTNLKLAETATNDTTVMDFCQGLQNHTGMNTKPQASLTPFLIILKNSLTSNLNLKCNI